MSLLCRISLVLLTTAFALGALWTARAMLQRQVAQLSHLNRAYSPSQTNFPSLGLG